MSILGELCGSACISPLLERMAGPPLPGLLCFLLGDSFHWEANQTVQRTGASRHAEWRCGRRRWLAPVADLRRSPSQADQESQQMETTGHGHASGEVHVIGFGSRHDDNHRRYGIGSAFASSAIFAARSTSSGSEPDGPSNGRQPARRVAMRTLPVAGSRH